MHAFLLLLRVQIRGLIHAVSPAARNNTNGRRRTKARFGLLAVAYILLGILAVVYLTLFGFALTSLGLGSSIPAFAVLIGAVAGVIFTFMKASGTLFGLADFDLIMSLPIPLRTVVASRLAALYGSAVALGAVVMLPLWGVYLALVDLSVWTVLCMAASLVLAPAIPTSIAIFLAFGVSAVSSRFRHAGIVYIVVALAAFSVFFVAMFAFNFSVQAGDHEQAMSQLEGLLVAADGTISAGWPPADWLARATRTGEALPLAAFVVVSLVACALTLEVIQRCYLSINSALSARTGRGTLSAERLLTESSQTSSTFRALVVKEYRMLLGVPSYAFNCLFGYLLMLIMAVALAMVGMRGLVVAFGANDATLSPEIYSMVAATIGNLLPWALAFCAIAGPSAACSVSMEGRSAWLMATSPLSVRTILGAKLAANALPVAVTLTAGAVILVASGEVDVLGASQVMLTGFGTFYLAVNIGLAADARRPNYGWTSPAEVVKRGFPVTLTVVGGMVLVAVGGIAGFALSMTLGAIAGSIWNLAVGAIGAAGGQLIFRRTCKTAKLML